MINKVTVDIFLPPPLESPIPVHDWILDFQRLHTGLFGHCPGKSPIMAYSHCTGAEQRLMGPNILYRNVHTGPRQEQEPDQLSPIVPVLSLSRSRCSVNKPLGPMIEKNRLRASERPNLD